MGAQMSELHGSARVVDGMLPFTQMQVGDLRNMYSKFREMGGRFALDEAAFVAMCPQHFGEVDGAGLFQAVFDTDHNGLVDAYEMMAAFAMAADENMKLLCRFVHELYDFNHSGNLTLDELTIMLRTVATGAAKIEPRVHVPTIDEIEKLSKVAFQAADADMDGEINMQEFEDFCFRHPPPEVRNFIKYWDRCVRVVPIAEGEKWSDDTFIGGDALYRDEFRPAKASPPPELVRWLRPHEFCPGEPRVFVANGTGGDISQGGMADQWFLGALALLSLDESLLRNLFIYTGQESQGRYCVQFFKDGDWQHVYIDDRIPCDISGKPLYARAMDPNEIWPNLIEKAYAKFHGSYEALIGGTFSYAIKDLTSCVTDNLTTSDPAVAKQIASGRLWERIAAAPYIACAARFTPETVARLPERLRHSILVDAIYGVSNAKVVTVTGSSPGEIKIEGSPHSVTAPKGATPELRAHLKLVSEMWAKSKEIQDSVARGGTATVRLVQLKNPWGLKEWDGAWSDGDGRWKTYGKTLDYDPAKSESSFWMPYEEFLSIFNHIYLCAIPDPGSFHKARKGTWTRKNSGGPMRYRKSLLGGRPPRPSNNGGADSESKGEGESKGDRGGAAAVEAKTSSSTGGDGGQAQAAAAAEEKEGTEANAEFVYNPQYALAVAKSTRLFIDLTQHDLRVKCWTAKKAYAEAIGFIVVKNAWDMAADRPAKLRAVPDASKLVFESRFFQSRSADTLVELEPGMYTIVVMTARPGVKLDFCIHIAADNPFQLRECAPSDEERRRRGAWKLGEAAAGDAATRPPCIDVVPEEVDEAEEGQEAVAFKQMNLWMQYLRDEMQGLVQKRAELVERVTALKEKAS